MLGTPVITRVSEILESSGRTDAEMVIGFTYRALAGRVYDTDDPTAAQLSAVRRAVARLVADGRAERGARRPTSYGDVPWRVELPPRPGYGEHYRRNRHGEEWLAYNPGGVVIFRAPTDEDRGAWRAWLIANGYGHLAAGDDD